MDWKDVLSSIDDLPPGDDNIEVSSEKESDKKSQTLTLIYEKKGRKGKPATIIIGFDMPDKEISALLSYLQSRLGVGGSSRGGEILLQGDCRERVAVLLREKGYKVKY